MQLTGQNLLKTGIGQQAFMTGGGEMGALMRAFDWSNTSLGAPDNWPKSLQTALAIILHSKFPMFMWWGPELLCFYNDAYRPSLGKEGKHPGILGQPAETAWAEIWPVIYPLIQQVLDGGEATWSEDQLIPIYRNGTLEDVYWTFSYSRITNDEGKAGGILVTCVETTQKVLNQKKLQETSELLQFSTDAAELGTWDYRPSSGKFTANKRLKSWFGLAPEQETDLQVAINAIAPKDQQRVTAAIAAAIDYAQQKPYDLEYTIINKQSGKEIIVLVRGKAYFDDSNEAYRFSGTMEDITEQVKARKVLEEAEERARLAIEAGDLGTFDLNLLTDEITTSGSFARIIGTSVISTHDELIKAIYPEDITVRENAFREALSTGELSYETRMIQENGTINWVRVHGRVFYDDKGIPQRLIGTVADVSDHKAAEQQREEYIAIASHELRNPLTSLKLSLDLLLANETNAENSWIGEKAKTQLQRIMTMTNEFLNVSKIASGIFHLNKEVFSLKTCIEESITTFQAGIIKNLVTVSGTPDINVFGDKFRVEQVMINLLSNASKYSPQGATIKVDVSYDSSAVKIQVTDKGIGIAAEKLPHIFKKFSRIEGSQVSGYGLGLYISQQIVHKHGGEMGVSSEIGKGSVFWFTVPIS